MSIQENEKVLNLTISKKWFDLINYGIRKEHYLDIKEYWNARLIKKMSLYTINQNQKPYGLEVLWETYSYVDFKYEYTSPANVIRVELKQIYLGLPVPEWSDKRFVDCFILVLGKKVSHSII